MDIDDFIALIEDEGLAPPALEAVARFEQEAGVTLPDDYRAFLARTVGGLLGSFPTFTWPESGQTEGVRTVFGLQSDEHLSLAAKVANAEEDGVPLDLIPIMMDPGGNAIALCIRPDRLGEVFFLDHEVADEGRPTLEDAEADDWGCALPLAPSFSAFITRLASGA